MPLKENKQAVRDKRERASRELSYAKPCRPATNRYNVDRSNWKGSKEYFE